MCELKKNIGKVVTSKFVGKGPSYYKKRIYRAAAPQRLRSTDISDWKSNSEQEPWSANGCTFLRRNVPNRA